MPASFSLIGCGRIGERHAALMQKSGRLLSVCDNIPERADRMAASYQTGAFYEIRDLITSAEKPDVAAVCTPNGLHAVHTIALLNAGIHVLCEKPMAISLSDCKNMIAASKANNRKLFIVKQNRFNPPLQALKQCLEQGRLGKIYSIQVNGFWNREADYYKDSWRGTLALDGGTLFTQFSHFVDLLYWLIGDLKSAQAILSNYAHEGMIEFEDTGMVLLEFENGVTGTLNYTVNSFEKNMEGSITVFGEKGTVKVGGEYLNKIEYQDIKNYRIGNMPLGNGANDYGLYQGSMSNHDKVYENLMGFLENKEPLYMNAEDGMKTVEMIEKIYRSAGRV